MLISKIVSGGQTGVDRGAIEAALELGFPYGSLIPKGRLAEDGIVPEKFDNALAVRWAGSVPSVFDPVRGAEFWYNIAK